MTVEFEPYKLDLDHYQQMAFQTAVYPERGTLTVNAILYCTMGLVGEAGEVANQVKKILRDDNGVLELDRQLKLIDEVGDCLWYVAMLARELGMRLSEIGEMNVKKLEDRRIKNLIHGDSRQGETNGV
jgi:NTP pyrophosphatase (non-canonical NTP hydrolase)